MPEDNNNVTPYFTSSDMDFSGLDFDSGPVGDIGSSPQLLSSTSGAQELDPDSFGAGVGAGLDQTQASLFGMVEAIGESFDVQSLESWGQQGRERNLQELEKYGQGVAFSDAESMSDWVDYSVRKAGELLPYLAGNVAAVAGGGLVGGPAGALGGQALYSGTTRVGEAKVRSEQLKPGEDLTGAELATAGGMSVVDMFLFSKLSKPFMKSTVQGSIEKMGKEATQEAIEKGAIKAGIAEGTAKQAAEGAVLAGGIGAVDAAITEAVAQDSAGNEVDWDSIYDMMKEASVVGGALGGTAGSVGGYIKSKNLNDFLLNKAEFYVDKAFADRGLARQVWDKFTGTAVDPLLPKLGKSETGRKLAATFKKIEGTGVEDLETVRRDLNARYSNAQAESFKAAKDYYGRNWKNKLVDDYKKGVNNEGTTGLRTLLTSLGEESIKRGLMSKEQLVDNYLPANLDKNRVLRDWDSFEKDLNDYGYDTSTPEHRAALNRYKYALETDNWSTFSDRMERIAAEDVMQTGRIMQGRISRRQQNIENSRYFPVRQEFYNKWSKRGNDGTQAINAIDSYVHETSHRHAAVDKLGANGEKLNQMIAQASKELDGMGEFLTPADVKRMYSIVEAYDNVFNRIENPILRNITSVLRTTATVSSLPLVLLSSITEPLNIAIKTDMGVFFEATSTVMARAGQEMARKAFLQRPSDGYNSRKAQASMGGQSLAQIDSVVMSRLTDPTVGNLSAAINKGFFRAVGLTWWTQAVRNMSSEAARIQIRNDLRLIKNSSTSGTGAGERARQRLTEMGMSTQDVAYLNSTGRKDTRVINEIYGRAVNRFNRDVVLEPSFADRPLWMSSQNMWFLAQLQGYPTMFTNTVLPKLGNKLLGTPSSTLDALFIAGAISMIGGAQITARDIVAGRDNDRSMTELLLASYSKYLTPKPINSITGLFTADSYGSSAVESLLGPISGLLNDNVVNIEGLVSGDEDIETTVWSIVQDTTPLRPFRNHFE